MSSNYVFPPFLKKGDKVIIISPSGKICNNIIEKGEKIIQSWGLETSIAPHAKGEYASFSGTIDERLTDLQKALDDEEARAIFCSRGGYGAIHLIDKLDFSKFRRSPKWVVGFSDITAIHYRIQSEGFASLHAPMLRHLAEEPDDDFCSNKIWDIISGQAFCENKQLQYTCSGNSLNHPGEADGTLKGGNLAVAYGLRGTRYDLIPEGTILFIEDVGEKPHAVERMVYNLKIGGVLNKLSGLIIGQFTDYIDHGSLGKDLYGALADILSDFSYPVCFNFPVGHVKANMPLIEGCKAEISVGHDKTTLILKK